MDRGDILGKACELYLAGGIETVSMRRLARELGVTAPALYRHYESRESVLLDVLSEAYRICAGYLQRALTGTTPANRFRQAGQGYLDFALDHPKLYEMMYLPTSSFGVAEFPEELTARIASVGQFFNDRVRECIDEGLLQPLDPQEVSLTLWAHAHGLISIYLRGCLPMDEETFRQAYVESCSRALHGMSLVESAAGLEEPAR